MQAEACASTSKRVLFPSTHQDGSNDSDGSLGHMSPLSMSSSPDRYSSPPPSPQWLQETPIKKISEAPLSLCYSSGDTHSPRRISRYDSYLRGLDQRMVTPSKPVQSAGLRKSPRLVGRSSTVQPVQTMETICETPEKSTPCAEVLATPFKCLMSKEVMPSKAELAETPDPSEMQKTLLNTVKSNYKRNHRYFSDSSNNTAFKLKPHFNPDTAFQRSVRDILQTAFYQSSAPKVRTALFPEPRRTLKPIAGIKRHRSPSVVSSRTASRMSQRGWVKRRRTGEINVGVFHRIRRPRPKKRKRPLPKLPIISSEDRINQFVMKNFGDDVMGVTLSENNKVVNQTAPEMELPVLKRLPSPVTDHTKKFFKTNRTLAINRRATVTIVNMRIQVSNGKLSLESSTKKKRKHSDSTSTNHASTAVEVEKVFEEDMVVDTAPDTVHQSVEAILNTLEVDSALQNSTCGIPKTQLSMQIGAGVLTTEDIPSKGLHLPEEPDKENASQSKKLYPVFLKQSKGLSDVTNTVIPKKKSSSTKKRWRPIGDDQYQIDAGQKWFGAIQCSDCGIVYQRGDPEDEISHERIHNNTQSLKFMGWKQERVVRAYTTGRVIVVYPDDPKAWLRKVKDVLEVVDRELGFVNCSMQSLSVSKVYLYVTDKRVLGCLVAEPKTEAYKMLNTGTDGIDCCTSEFYPVKCGVSRIWTVADQRRCQVASHLMDCLRLTFMFDRILGMNDFAFSVPTISGKAFAEKYTGTSEFMVYN